MEWIKLNPLDFYFRLLTVGGCEVLSADSRLSPLHRPRSAAFPTRSLFSTISLLRWMPRPPAQLDLSVSAWHMQVQSVLSKIVRWSARAAKPLRSTHTYTTIRPIKASSELAQYCRVQYSSPLCVTRTPYQLPTDRALNEMRWDAYSTLRSTYQS